jgi:hypothetical protein
MKRPFAFLLATVAASFTLLSTPSPAIAASTFYGIVSHVSDTNIKVDDTRTGQTLSFEIVPHFDQIFSSNGKTTYQMRELRPGRYVGVIYDQKMLGMRHADKVYILNDANQRIGQP